MQNHLLPLIWVCLTGLLGGAGGMQRNEKVLGREERRATWMYALIVVVPLIYWATYRWMYFADTTAYIGSYWRIPEGLAAKWAYVKSAKKDVGFSAFSALVSIIAGRRFRVYLGLIAIIQGLCLAKTYRKYSCDYWFAMFVFVATTDYISWMMNGIRQFMAVAICFGAAGYIFRKKYIRAMIVIAFASLFHQTALMMIPIIFIVQGKPWNWKTLLLILGTVVAMSASGVFTSALDSMLADTQYANVVSDWTSWKDNGTNPLRVLVYSVPTILSLFCRKQIRKENDRVISIACNMGIVSTALYMISMVTSGIFIGRLPIYCSLYANGILLPWELKHVFGRTLRTMAIVAYVGFFFVQTMLAW